MIEQTIEQLAVSDLRPFFGFYGGKWRDAIKHYPDPRHRTVVEPFAGSAGFSVRYAHLDIVLCEVDPIIASVWTYLTKVKPREILKIPDVPLDGTVEDLNLAQEAEWLVGFWLNRGVSRPVKRPSKWMRDGIYPGSFWGDRVRDRIAGRVHPALEDPQLLLRGVPSGSRHVVRRPAVSARRQALHSRLAGDRLRSAGRVVQIARRPGHRVRERRCRLASISPPC